jgi:hypothetical protein
MDADHLHQRMNFYRSVYGDEPPPIGNPETSGEAEAGEE